MSNSIGLDTEPRNRGWVRKTLIVLIPILILVGFFIATSIIIQSNKKPKEKRSPWKPLAVLALPAVQDDVQLQVRTQGEAKPRTEIDLVPEVSGKVISVSPKFVSGGVFNKGDVLYQLDRTDYNVGVIRAEAAVARAKQVLVREQAEAEIAKREWEDLGRGAPSDLTLRKPQLAEAQASLQSAEADLQNAKTQLYRTAVRAPFNGRVKQKNSGLGQYVSPGTRLGTIFSSDVMEVRLPLSDDDLAKVNLPIAYVAKDHASAPDVKLHATIAGQYQTWNAKIMRTDSSYDRQSRALFAIAEVFDPYGKGASDLGVPLAPGLFVDAEVLGKTFNDVVVLPRDGLRPENKIYVAQEDGSTKTIIGSVIDTTMSEAYVRAGDVNPGDIILVGPVEESRLIGPLKIVDQKDPSKVYIDPPKPEWLVEKEKAAEEAAKNGGKKGKKKKSQDTSEDTKTDETTNSDSSD